MTRTRITTATILGLAVPMLLVAAVWLWDWRWRGTGPAYKKLGRHVRYRWPDVEKWLDDNAHGGTQ